MADLRDVVDVVGRLRYGKGGTAKKEADAARGKLPGAPKNTSADLEKANRYSAGYHFGKTWPKASKVGIKIADYLHGLAGDKPEVQSYATSGAAKGRAEAEQEEADEKKKREARMKPVPEKKVARLSDLE